MYYLAVGKLHVGFYKNDNSSEIESTLQEITKIYRLISSYLGRDVYVKNIHAKPIIGEIRKTNILTMHKDYKHVYALYQAMNKKAVVTAEPGKAVSQTRSQRYYEQFCQMLTLFAAAHFNFKPDTSDIVVKKAKPAAKLKFKRWTMSIDVKRKDNLGCNIIDLQIGYKKNLLRYAIIPTSYYVDKDKNKECERIITQLLSTKSKIPPYDKYIFLDPFDYDNTACVNDYSIRFVTEKEEETYYSILPASISDVNSFRRIQRLIFEAMTRVSKARETCAHCGEKLSIINNQKLLCAKCKTTAYNIDCFKCKKKFAATYFDAPKAKFQKNIEVADYVKHMPKFFRQEIEHRFRNITKIRHSNFVCPHCNTENELADGSTPVRTEL